MDVSIRFHCDAGISAKAVKTKAVKEGNFSPLFVLFYTCTSMWCEMCFFAYPIFPGMETSMGGGSDTGLVYT